MRPEESCNPVCFCGITVNIEKLNVTVVVMRDAAGVRRESGKQAAAINQMSRELNKKKNFDMDLLTELLGHTPLQVFFGGVLGILMAYLCQLWLFPMIFPPM